LVFCCVRFIEVFSLSSRYPAGSKKAVAGQSDRAIGNGLVSLAGKARSQACSQAVQAVRRDHPGLSFEEAWQIAASENKKLFTPSESGGELSDEQFQADYQLRMHGIRK